MKEYFIHICSSYNDENNFLDFTVNLPFSINLNNDETWEMGISEVTYGIKKKKYPNMLLCCDKIQHSIINDKTLGILRFLCSSIGNTKKIFTHVNYFDLLERRISTLRLYIKVLDEGSFSFPNDILYCTLHLRKKNEVHTIDRRQQNVEGSDGANT